MAGGWNRQGSGVPLADRVRAGAPATAPPIHATPPGPTCPARHCWVSDAADGDGTKRPGLLLEWRQQEARWEGRVVYAAHLRADSWGLVEEWLPAALLTPL